MRNRSMACSLFTSIMLASSLSSSGTNSDDSNSLEPAYVIKLSMIEGNSDARSRYNPTRIDVDISNGQITNTERLISGKWDSSQDIRMMFFIAPNYFAQVAGKPVMFDSVVSKTTEVKDDNHFSYQIRSKNGKKTLIYDHDLTEVDISGVNIADKNYRVGLNKFELDKSSFPAGSSCYVVKSIKPNFSHFTFDSQDNMLTSSIHSIEEWLDVMKGYATYSESTILEVGNQNQYRAAYIDRAKDQNYYTAVVEYKGQIYNASYRTLDGIFNNDNPDKEEVDCYLLNTLAANYLEDEIKKYATLQKQTLEEIMNSYQSQLSED